MQRFGIFALALSVALVGRPSLANAGDGEDGAEELPGEGAATAAAPASADKNGGGSARAKGKGAIARKGKSRRGRRGRKARVKGHAVPESQLLAEPLPPPSGKIRLHSIATNEEVEVSIFNADGSYNNEAVAQVSHLLRCKRTDTEKPIEPRLMVILSRVYDHYGKRLDVVSGYRNQRRQTSFHFQGSASDIRIQGVPPKKLASFAQTLDAGGMGIGYYPRSKFVHLDVRPPPSYRWIDYARPTPNAPDKRPPRGFKRKKLQS